MREHPKAWGKGDIPGVGVFAGSDGSAHRIIPGTCQHLAEILPKKGRETTENVRLAIILGFDAAPPATKLPARGLWHRRGAECAESAMLL